MNINELAQAIVDGKQLQYMPVEGLWENLSHGAAVRRWADITAMSGIRIAPTLTPVDMSLLVGSGIDCTFTGGGDYRHGPLIGICGENYKLGTDCGAHSAHSRCVPRMDHWHSLYNCQKDIAHKLNEAGFLVVSHPSGTAIRIPGLVGNRCYPWESDQ